MALLNFDWPIWIASLTVFSCPMCVYLVHVCLSVSVIWCWSVPVHFSVYFLLSVCVWCMRMFSMLTFCLCFWISSSSTGPWIRTTYITLYFFGFFFFWWSKHSVRIKWMNRHGQQLGTRTGRFHLSWKKETNCIYVIWKDSVFIAIKYGKLCTTECCPNVKSLLKITHQRALKYSKSWRLFTSCK